MMCFLWVSYNYGDYNHCKALIYFIFFCIVAYLYDDSVPQLALMHLSVCLSVACSSICPDAFECVSKCPDAFECVSKS